MLLHLLGEVEWKGKGRGGRREEEREGKGRRGKGRGGKQRAGGQGDGVWEERKKKQQISMTLM